MCYNIKSPANGYDFPKYNQVSGWLAGWLNGGMTKEKLCTVSLPVKFRQTLFLCLWASGSDLPVFAEGQDTAEFYPEKTLHHDSAFPALSPATFSWVCSLESNDIDAFTLQAVFGGSTNLCLFLLSRTYVQKLRGTLSPQNLYLSLRR